MFAVEVRTRSHWHEVDRTPSLDEARTFARRAPYPAVRVIDLDRPMLKIGRETTYRIVWAQPQMPFFSNRSRRSRTRSR